MSDAISPMPWQVFRQAGLLAGIFFYKWQRISSQAAPNGTDVEGCVLPGASAIACAEEHIKCD